MIFLTVTETWFLYIGIVAAVILLIGVILFFTCGLRSRREKKIEHITIDNEFMDSLILGLGNSANIESVSIDNGRLKFKVKDLELLDTNRLKELSTSGVFITANNVKLLFKYDSESILKELKNRGV